MLCFLTAKRKHNRQENYIIPNTQKFTQHLVPHLQPQFLNYSTQYVGITRYFPPQTSKNLRSKKMRDSLDSSASNRLDLLKSDLEVTGILCYNDGLFTILDALCFIRSLRPSLSGSPREKILLELWGSHLSSSFSLFLLKRPPQTFIFTLPSVRMVTFFLRRI